MLQQLSEPVRSTMQALVSGLVVVLGTRLVGVYLGGSVTTEDFSDSSSDLDFLVVTDGELSLEDALGVSLLHRDLLKRYPYAARLEGDYAPLAWLCPEGTTAPVPGCERGVFLPKVGEIMLSAENVYNMREQGIACYGPEPKAIFPPVAIEAVRTAVRPYLFEPGAPCDTAAEAADQLLDLLRSAAAIESGIPTTKVAGARWARANLESRWQGVVEAALAVRAGTGTAEDEALCLQVLPELHRFLQTKYC
ncbi:MAG: hypothetical protein ACM3XM_07035 [Mycobacterium leprae]